MRCPNDFNLRFVQWSPKITGALTPKKRDPRHRERSVATPVARKDLCRELVMGNEGTGLHKHAANGTRSKLDCKSVVVENL